MKLHTALMVFKNLDVKSSRFYGCVRLGNSDLDFENLNPDFLIERTQYQIQRHSLNIIQKITFIFSFWILNEVLNLSLATTLYCFIMRSLILVSDQLQLRPLFRISEVVAYESLDCSKITRAINKQLGKWLVAGKSQTIEEFIGGRLVVLGIPNKLLFAYAGIH